MSTSNSQQATTTETIDARQVVDNGAIAVGGESHVTINQVPDEAIEMGGEVIQALARVVEMETEQDRSEAAQLADSLIKIGIPAALILFVVIGPGRNLLK